MLFGQLLRLGHRLLDGPHHVEGLLGEVVVFTWGGDTAVSGGGNRQRAQLLPPQELLGEVASPARICLKPLMVSFSGTSLPMWPVKTSATWKGCDKKRWILRARATVSLSSSDSSSMPRMAMMSCRDL